MKYIQYVTLTLLLFPLALFCTTVSQTHKNDFPPTLVSANADLMREHGILNRVLLIYQELSRRINNRIPFPQDTLLDTAKITRDFLENFHEKMEEEYVFPYYEKANIYQDTIKTLIKQHQDGRKIIDYLLIHSSVTEVQDEVQAMVLAGYMSIFSRMFRPHEAKESSELFPLLQSLMSPEEYIKLGEQFEKIGEDMFGKNGYEILLTKLTSIEKKLNLNTLELFTI